MQVPVETNISEQPGLMPNARVSDNVSPGEAASAANVTQQTGEAMAQAGRTAGNIATDVQDMANQVRVNAALNDVRDAQSRLLYDPQAGALNLRGENALNRPDGKSLTDEYSEKLQDQISQAGATLSNPMQQRLFNVQARGVLTNFRGTLDQHLMGEFVKHSADVTQTAIDQNVQAAAQSNGDPEAIDSAVMGHVAYGDDGKPLMANGQPVRMGGIVQAVDTQAKLLGWSPEQRNLAIQEKASGVYASAIRMAINTGDPDKASELFDRYGGDLTDKDALEIAPQMRQLKDAQTALSVATQTASDYTQAFQPDPQQRLNNIAAQMESGGRDYDKDGNPVTSSRGALYRMQVLPDVAKNPGFGIEPAKDDSPAEYNRVGEHLLPTLVKRYGDVGMGLAAYNAGYARVDEAIADAKKNSALVDQYNANLQQAAQAAAANPTPENEQALAGAKAARDAVVSGSNWLNLLPKETQDYATKGEQAFMAGEGRPVVPTEMEFVNKAILHLNEVTNGNPTPQQVLMVRSRASQQYDLLNSNIKDQANQAWMEAQRALISVNGDESAVPPAVYHDLLQKAPDKLDNYHQFAKALNDGQNSTNFTSYNWAISHPDELAKMSDADFQAWQTTQLGGHDREMIGRLRQEAITGKATAGPDSLDTGSINELTNNRLQSLGVETGNAGDQQQLGALRRFINDKVMEQQQATGKRLHYADLEPFIDSLFAKNLELRNSYLGGLVTTTSQQTMLTMKASDIPDADAAAIRQQFQRRGIQNPSDQDMLRMYWHAHTQPPRVQQQ